MDSELCLGKRSILPSCSSGNSLPEGPNVLGELDLTSGGGNKDDVLLPKAVELAMSNRLSRRRTRF